MTTDKEESRYKSGDKRETEDNEVTFFQLSPPLLLVIISNTELWQGLFAKDVTRLWKPRPARLLDNLNEVLCVPLPNVYIIFLITFFFATS